MKKTILGTIALVALLTITTIGTASAHYGRGGYWHGGGRPFVHVSVAAPVAYCGPSYGGAYYGGGYYGGGYVAGGYYAPRAVYYGHPNYYARPNYNYHNGYGRAPYHGGGRGRRW